MQRHINMEEEYMRKLTWFMRREQGTKKKETGMAKVADASPSNSKSANMVQDTKWALSVHCSYNPYVHDACMFVCRFSRVVL